MNGVLPDSSSPNVDLVVNGISYYYVMEKETEADVSVYVRNIDPVNGGYVFEEVDDWSGLPSNSIQKYFRFTGTEASRWGDGEISVDGDGVISDPSVVYLYRMDVTEPNIICSNPLLNPQCPGFLEALYKYLSTLDYLSEDDPYYDEWVQIQLERAAELEESVIIEEPEEDDDLETFLFADPEVGGLIDYDQQENVMDQLSAVGVIEPYFEFDIPGNEYKETIQLKDKKIPENNRALRNLANSARYNSMVRSQYERDN